MSKNVAIRKALKSDIDSILRCFLNYREDINGLFDDRFKEMRKEKSEGMIRKSLLEILNETDNRFLVAESEAKMVGFALGYIKNFKHMAVEPYKYGVIKMIWVADELRGSGIASDFKDELLLWFSKNKCTQVRLQVLLKNPARDIYENWGFEPFLETRVLFLD